MTAIDAELTNLKQVAVDLNDVVTALSEFDALWDVLVPAERSRLVHLLVERVVGSADSDIQVVFGTSQPR
jgi:hypothetical protein